MGLRAMNGWERSRIFGIGCSVLVCATSLVAAQAKEPGTLARAHAHNDYWHERPLVDALELGFASVEADVFLVEGKLLVGHDRSELRTERTLESLYLTLLGERARRNGGNIFGDGTRLTLLVDFKSEGPATYAALDRLLEKYGDLVSSVVDGEVQSRAVVVVVSGDRPVEVMAAERKRFAAIDGRLAELNSDLPVHLVPLVSENWVDHFKWDGQGEMPADERAKLREIVKRVHDQGRRMRYWATPETEECWRELVAANVDLIGTDELGRLAGLLGGNEARTNVQTGR